MKRSWWCFYEPWNTKGGQKSTRSEGRGMEQVLPHSLRRSQPWWCLVLRMLRQNISFKIYCLWCFVLTARGSKYNAFWCCVVCKFLDSPWAFPPGPFWHLWAFLEMHIFYSSLESQLMDHEYKLSFFMLHMLVFESNLVSHYIIHQCSFEKLWPFLKVRSI